MVIDLSDQMAVRESPPVDRPEEREHGRPRLALLESFSAAFDGGAVSIPMSGQRLLALLAVHNSPLRRPYVAGSLWLTSSEAHAGGCLRSTLWRLGRLGVKFVETSESLLRLSPTVSVDLYDAQSQARRLLDRSVPCRPTDLACESLTRDLLAGWYDDWVLIERERFRQLRLHALEAICERLIALERFGEAVEAGLAAVAGEPLRESAHRFLIQAYLAEGNRVEALRQFRWYAQLLREELQAEASPLMQNLVRDLQAS